MNESQSLSCQILVITDNANISFDFQILWYGCDGLMGPILSGTGFYIKREALYSIDKERGTYHPSFS